MSVRQVLVLQIAIFVLHHDLKHKKTALFAESRLYIKTYEVFIRA